MEANVSGREVPMATKVMAVTPGVIPKTHPRLSATYPTMKVIKPIREMAVTKQAHPPIM